jgi:hypothetical protein
MEDHIPLHRGDVEFGNRVKWNISVARGKEKKRIKYLNFLNWKFIRSGQILGLNILGSKIWLSLSERTDQKFIFDPMWASESDMNASSYFGDGRKIVE